MDFFDFSRPSFSLTFSIFKGSWAFQTSVWPFLTWQGGEEGLWYKPMKILTESDGLLHAWNTKLDKHISGLRTVVYSGVNMSSSVCFYMGYIVCLFDESTQSRCASFNNCGEINLWCETRHTALTSAQPARLVLRGSLMPHVTEAVSV